MTKTAQAAKSTQARAQVLDLVNAIQDYDAAYGRLPISSSVQTAAAAMSGDFTYGGNFQNGSGAGILGILGNGSAVNNSEVIAILMAFTNYPNGSGPIANQNHQKNAQETHFLNAKLSGWGPSQPAKPSPGVGNDLVCRDPWGDPYLISLDLNYDGQYRDANYSIQKVSQILQPLRRIPRPVLMD